MNNELAVRESVQAEISGFEMKPRTLKEAMDFCDLIANSDLVPNAYKGKPGNIMVAIQMGSELGLSPMRALRSIAVINGRATMWGDDVLAMVLHSPVCEYVDESASNSEAGICKTKRQGCAEQVSIFTLADAKRAGLLGKQGPWQTNTSRMLKLRARGFGLRDTFADVLAGLVTAEEALDLPPADAAPGPETLLEANQPLSLKDKLKAKVEAIDAPADITAHGQTDGLNQGDESLDDPGLRGIKEIPMHTHGVATTQASLLAAYLDQLALSQSVAECSATLNTALKDTSLSVFEVTQLQDAGKAKIVALRKR